MYKLLINSKEGAGKIYSVLKGTSETGKVYDWQLSKDDKFRGIYNNSIIYYIDDIVYYNNNFYIGSSEEVGYNSFSKNLYPVNYYSIQFNDLNKNWSYKILN